MKKRKNTKRPKSYNLDARIRNALRRIWFWGPQRKQAVKSAKISSGLFLCANCVKPHAKICVDHKIRVSGEGGWDGYIQRLFCPPDGLQCLCYPCHAVKTKEENEQRKKLLQSIKS